MLPAATSWGRKLGLVVVLQTEFSAGERLLLLEEDTRITDRDTCAWQRRQAPWDLTPKGLVCGVAADGSEEVSRRRGEHLLFASSNKHNNDIKVLIIDQMSVVPLPSASLAYHHLLFFRYVKLDDSLYSLPCKVDLLEI